MPIARALCSFKRAKRVADHKETACSSPTCVRCRNYKRVLSAAALKLKNMDSVSTRVRTSMEKSQQIGLYPGQRPNVFAMASIRAKPWWPRETFQTDVDVLESAVNSLRDEFEIAYSDKSALWQRNQTPSGQWDIFHFVNQGKLIEQNCKLCPKTFATINRLAHFLRSNVFGNASFSVVEPKSHIAPHCGPTNIRLRCHVALFVPPGCHMRVHAQSRQWVEGECLLFDDSFEHEVRHAGKSDDGARVVFMIDMWHPDITTKERRILNELFNPKNDI